MDVLAAQGVRFHHPESLDRFRQAGAEILDGNMVRIPPQLLAWALQVAPKQVTLYRRDGRPAIEFGSGRSYFGAGLNCTHINDSKSGNRRPALLADLTRAVQLVDTLPNLNFVTPIFWPSDVPKETGERYQMEVMLTECSKPILFTSSNRSSMMDMLEMAAFAAGGRESLAARPFIATLVRPAFALNYDEQVVQNLLLSAGHQVPIICAPQTARPAAGSGCSPAAIRAGQLAGLVLAQLVRERTPFILDPVNSAGYSNAKLFDAQAAAEAALTLFVTIQNRSKLIHRIGCLDKDQTGSLGLIACCDELVAWIMHSLGKTQWERWTPQLLDWDDYETWAAAGALTLEERVSRRVEDLLASHRPEALPTTIRFRIKGIIQRANASVRWTKGS